MFSGFSETRYLTKGLSVGIVSVKFSDSYNNKLSLSVAKKVTLAVRATKVYIVATAAVLQLPHF